LNEKIVREFGKELNVDIVLYLGLCNGAGWVTNINGFDIILLGIEKIIELNWVDQNSMYGLVYHELGHVYQKQYGVLEQESDDNKRNFVWQLFIEGIAMFFEQKLLGNFDYYHQDVNGWKKYCEDDFTKILYDFNQDLPSMTHSNQRYFGDWCNYNGKGDVGYYLGARFVHFLHNNYTFDQIICFNIDFVYDLYYAFIRLKL
jgi:hypothetical protein